MADPILLEKQSYIAVQLEAATGTEPTWAAADFIQVIDFKREPVSKSEQMNVHQASLSQGESIVTSITDKISFSVPLWAPDQIASEADTPRYGDLLTACAMTVAEDAGVGTEHTDIDPGSPVPLANSTAVGFKILETETIMSYMQTAYGSVKYIFESGKIPRMEFSFFGMYNAPLAYSGMPTWTVEARNDHPWRNVDFDMRYGTDTLLDGATTPVLHKIEIDMGVEVVERDNACATYASEGFVIVSRKPTMTVVFEKDHLVANAATEAMISGDLLQLQFGFGDPDLSDDITTARGQVYVPQAIAITGTTLPEAGAKIVDVKEGSANGVITTELSCDLFGSDDELQITLLRESS